MKNDDAKLISMNIEKVFNDNAKDNPHNPKDTTKYPKYFSCVSVDKLMEFVKEALENTKLQ